MTSLHEEPSPQRHGPWRSPRTQHAVPAPSRRSRHRILAIAVVSGILLALVVLATGAKWALSGGLYGCTNRDERLASTLSQLDVLRLHPGDATLQGQYSGCDEDDGFAYAGRHYRPTSNEESILAFYRTRTLAAGWTLSEENATPVPPKGLVTSASRLCFTKPLNHVTGYLSVWFPSDFGDNTTDYGVEVTASHDGAAGC